MGVHLYLSRWNAGASQLIAILYYDYYCKAICDCFSFKTTSVHLLLLELFFFFLIDWLID